MFGLDSIPGFGKYVALAERVVGLAERIITEGKFREKWLETGKITGTFSLDEYRVKFEIEDTKRTAIPAEITEAE
ncbi:hypothetical protein [Methanorbis furvi]|uniref:Uncharacterized protein n=1 Tax=Methanorbis furvi TaxID=3028299 RepID=A0AAE4MF29_9EURY|nr:hypothetical protein [Methanocorpusculaceae archaeon Ag1]